GIGALGVEEHLEQRLVVAGAAEVGYEVDGVAFAGPDGLGQEVGGVVGGESQGPAVGHLKQDELHGLLHAFQHDGARLGGGPGGRAVRVILVFLGGLLIGVLAAVGTLHGIQGQFILVGIAVVTGAAAAGGQQQGQHHQHRRHGQPAPVHSNHSLYHSSLRPVPYDGG